MLNEIRKDAQERMSKSLEALDKAFKRVRTGRAHPSLLDGITVSYYGADTPLAQLANVSVEEGRTLTISPFEKPLIPEIEKALLMSDIGITPSTSGDLIRLPMPALTEETRRDLVKRVKAEVEGARVAIRNIRRDANADIKELLKEKEISEDEERKGESDIQTLTDKMVAEADAMLKNKEKDLMEI